MKLKDPTTRGCCINNRRLSHLEVVSSVNFSVSYRYQERFQLSLCDKFAIERCVSPQARFQRMSMLCFYGAGEYGSEAGSDLYGRLAVICMGARLAVIGMGGWQ